jgi:hypothetical protein
MSLSCHPNPRPVAASSSHMFMSTSIPWVHAGTGPGIGVYSSPSLHWRWTVVRRICIIYMLIYIYANACMYYFPFERNVLTICMYTPS